MRTLNRVGSIAAGAVLLGAAVSGAVNAALDSTGLTKGFFYDAGYNPIVQIVVGEKGMATDAVAAGNIAAVIGNLAYTSTEAMATEGTASGQVVLGVAARGATGKYEQALKNEDGTQLIKVNRNSDSRFDFYDENEGLYFNSSSPDRRTVTYNRGEFISYSLACDQQERTESGILKKGTYNNVHCLFCETLCLSQLQNPAHDLEESIMVDYNKITWFEDGLRTDRAESLALKIGSNALTYVLDAGDIPMNNLADSAGEPIDFEWRGQFILFGEEYFTKDIAGTDKIYLAKGRILDDISSEGYTSEYMGYKFKIDHLIYSAEYQVAGILLDVEKPDGTIVQTQISKMANGIVDDIEIAGIYAEEASAVATASIIVYDTTTNVLLQDGKDLELGGEVKRYWRVRLTTGDANAATDISEYSDVTAAGKVLNNVTVTYRHNTKLEVGQALEFPSTYKVIFSGFRTRDYVESPCSGAGEGDILVEREDRYRGLISFTGDDGQRYNEVYMDQGPFGEGDMFVNGGTVYEYDDANNLVNDNSVMRVTLRDLLNGGRKTYNLDAVAQSTSFSLYKYSFEEAYLNDQEVRIEPLDDENDTDVYIGAGPDQYILYDAGDIYIVKSDNTSVLANNTIGLDEDVFSNAGVLTKFDLSDSTLEVKIVNENGSVYKQGVTHLADNAIDLNRDRARDADDRLIQFKANDREYMVIDFYSRSFNDSVDTYYSQGVWASGNALPTDDTEWSTSDYSYKWDDERDTLVILPESGLTATINYGSARQVQSVAVCMPKKQVWSTLFIGTGEQAATIDAIITKADEGTEKTVGCCSYLVKEFGVSTAGGSAMSVQVNPIVGNLVVPEIAADTTKNLIIVGGPAVNGMAGLTRDEIQAAPGQYVVRKDGNKVYVAGWTAADTVDAGNALIAWLQDNVHA
jgi:hypothetical protein